MVLLCAGAEVEAEVFIRIFCEVIGAERSFLLKTTREKGEMEDEF
jgi:hypothetical protein